MKERERQVEEAKKLFKDCEYKEALVIYDELFADKSLKNSKDDWKEYMVCLRERLRYHDSIKIAESILEKYKNDEDALLNLCICNGKQQRHREAIDFYEQILKEIPEYKKNIGYYAYLNDRVGDVERAEQKYQESFLYEPDNIWNISHYAMLLQKIGKNEKAITIYEKAIKETPKDTWLIKKFLILYGEINGKEKVYDYYKKLIEQDQKNYNLYINFAEYALSNQDINTAKKILSLIKIENVPLVLQIILGFYHCFIYIIKENNSCFSEGIKVMQSKREQYNAYIHRDFSALEDYTSKYFNNVQKIRFKELLGILEERG